MTDHWYIGIDIGGTTSAVVLINESGKVREREEFRTGKGDEGWQETVSQFQNLVREFRLEEHVAALGISCGGPLDTGEGLILSPPNLPDWDEVPIVDLLREEFPGPVALENDANAGALAEWKYGAGKDCHNLIYLTFGTGLGAGLILNGELYRGTNGFGGEVGHIRLDDFGPVGYHKRGSFEGYCSGPGFSQMMGMELLALQEEIGREAMLSRYMEPGEVTGRDVVEWAVSGEPLATEVIKKSGEYFGRGLSILIDILNPERIVVGSMGVRLGKMLFDPAREVISREALHGAAEVCEIVPAALGGEIGDYAALCVALEAEKEMNSGSSGQDI